MLDIDAIERRLRDTGPCVEDTLALFREVRRLQRVAADRAGAVVEPKYAVSPQCPECGPVKKVDEDGCCASCGADVDGPWHKETTV